MVDHYTSYNNNKNNIIFLKKRKFNFKLDFGIGCTRFKFFLLKLGLNLNHGVKRFFKLRIDIIKRYKKIIFKKKWIIVRRLKYRLNQKLIFLKKLKNYKYLRFKYGLPVNGQRTHTNRKNTFKKLIRKQLSIIPISKRKQRRLFTRTARKRNSFSKLNKFSRYNKHNYFRKKKIKNKIKNKKKFRIKFKHRKARFKRK